MGDGDRHKEATTQGLLFLFSTSDASREPSIRDLAISVLSLNGAQRGAMYEAGEPPIKAAILEFAVKGARNESLVLSEILLKRQLQPRSGTVQFRSYKLINARACADFDDRPSNIVQFVSLEPGEGLTQEEFNDWYEKEHTPLYSQIPGWRRTLRGQLLDTNENIDKFGRYLAIHEWESVESYKTEQYLSAINTPWQKRIIGLVDQSKRERIVFELDSELVVQPDEKG